MNDPTVTLERIAWFVGQIARPFAIMWTALCAGIAALVLAAKLDDPIQACIFIGAVYATGLTPLYLGKSAEESSKAKSAATVERAKAQNPTGAE